LILRRLASKSIVFLIFIYKLQVAVSLYEV
jgi:hypothetical protein